MRSKAWSLTSVLFSFAIVLAPAGVHGQAASQGTIVPFVRAFGLIFVELAWPNGTRLLALLDTGANASAIDPRKSADLPVERITDVVGTTGSVRAEVVSVPPLRLGSVALDELHATRRDLSGLLSPDGHQVDVILGVDALLQLAVTIDYRQSQLEITTISRPDTAGSVAMLLDNGIPTVPATLDGLPLRLRLDTGASLFETKDIYVNVPPAVWDALRTRTPSLNPTSHLQGTGANGRTVDLPVVRLARSTIGPLDVDSLFIIVQPALGYFASREALGFVSNNFLEKLGRVTLDFPAGRLFRER